MVCGLFDQDMLDCGNGCLFWYLPTWRFEITRGAFDDEAT